LDGSELKAWHDDMAVHVLQQPGVVFTGIDHAKNRLVIGVENSNVRSLVEHQVAGLGVPREAVNFMEAGPIELTTPSTLQDPQSPLVGGLEIGYGKQHADGTFPVCTLGFIAKREGVLGFVTASHCSSKRSIADGTVYTQPAGGFRIGAETFDPGFHGCRCLIPGHLCAFRCRYSDSNFSRLSSLVPADLGEIAAPSPTQGIPTAWNGTTFSISAGAGEGVGEGDPFVGEPVILVGRTSGLQDGHVLLTGLTIPVEQPSRHLLENQVLATYSNAQGDSGGPVVDGFFFTILEGINWGRIGGWSLFSTIRGIQSDLGPLTFVAPDAQPNPNADLVPVSPPGVTQFCKVVGGQRSVAVRVSNLGGGFASNSITRVTFPDTLPDPLNVPVPTQSLVKGQSVDLPLIAIPVGCGHDCNFVITVDSLGQVDEGSAGEANNTAVATCT
jgi:hypothetical protein